MAEKIEYIGKCLLIKDEGKKILVIGDLHLGYEESLNQSGVFISRQMFDEMISEFDLIFGKVGDVEGVVLLGDLKHEMGGILKQEWNDILGLWDYLHKHCKKIIVTRGNHDNYLLNIASKRDFVSVVDFYVGGEFCFMHGNKDFMEIEGIYDKKTKYWVIGHAHPAVKLSDGMKVEKYKCFLEGKYKDKKVIIVPSFIEYNEGTDVRERDFKLAWDFDFGNFNVYIVGENLEVLNFGKLKRLK